MTTFHTCKADGSPLGEFSESDFREKIFSGELQPEDYYWCEGFSNWRAVSEYRTPAKEPKKPPAVPPPLPTEYLARLHDRVCVNCGYVGRPKQFTKGNIGTEILLWLFFLRPGLLYSLWRITSRYAGCPKCDAPNMIPPDSPLGRKLFQAQR